MVHQLLAAALLTVSSAGDRLVHAPMQLEGDGTATFSPHTVKVGAIEYHWPLLEILWRYPDGTRWRSWLGGDGDRLWHDEIQEVPVGEPMTAFEALFQLMQVKPAK